jgi:nitrate reductase molybdenum cofactor assembly chaperone
MGIPSSFADLLDYPCADLPQRLDRCLAAVGGSDGVTGDDAGAVGALLRLRVEVERLGIARLEEAYTAAFDMDPGCSLYVGHHLFGETQHRSLFMSRLAAIYRDAGFAEAGAELPDYLPTLLRFVDGAGVAEESRATLVDEAIAPAARAIAEALEQRDAPYALAVRALVAALGVGLPATASNRERATT